MNGNGQVLSWQFTKTESLAEVKPLIQGVFDHFRRRNCSVVCIMLDNCCQWHAFLKDIFGNGEVTCRSFSCCTVNY